MTWKAFLGAQYIGYYPLYRWHRDRHTLVDISPSLWDEEYRSMQQTSRLCSLEFIIFYHENSFSVSQIGNIF